MGGNSGIFFLVPRYLAEFDAQKFYTLCCLVPVPDRNAGVACSRVIALAHHGNASITSHPSS